MRPKNQALLTPLFPFLPISRACHAAARAWEEGEDPDPADLRSLDPYSVFAVEALERGVPVEWGGGGRVWVGEGVRRADLIADPAVLTGFLADMARGLGRRRPDLRLLARMAAEMAQGEPSGFLRVLGAAARGWSSSIPGLEAAYVREGGRVRLLICSIRLPSWSGEAEELIRPPGWQRLALLLEEPGRRRAAIRAAIRQSRGSLPADWAEWLPPGVLVEPIRPGRWWVWEPGSGLAEEVP